MGEMLVSGRVGLFLGIYVDILQGILLMAIQSEGFLGVPIYASHGLGSFFLRMPNS